METPLTPRITKSTSVAAIQARFGSTEELLKRFEVAKAQANLWDGERDGLREAVKVTEPGQYGKVLLSKSESAPVLYPNSTGKFHLEECVQSTVSSEFSQGIPRDAQILIFAGHEETGEQFLDTILHYLQQGKDKAVEFLQSSLVGTGRLVPNEELYEKKGSEKASITVLP